MLFRSGGLCMMVPGVATDVIGLVAVAAVIVFQRAAAKRQGLPA